MMRMATAVILALSLLASAAGGLASETEEAYVPVDYQLYPAPEDAYVGDTMPYDGGRQPGAVLPV